MRNLRCLLPPVVVAITILLLAFLTLIPPENGVVDVHVPPSFEPLLDRLGADHYVVGKGFGRVAGYAATLIGVAEIAMLLVLIWALIKRRGRVAWWCASLLLVSLTFAPRPEMNQPQPPIAVSSRVATALIAQTPTAERESPPIRYLRAQLAYLDGDRSGAARLAQGLDGDDLASPIEAPYRLQYLRAEPITVTTVCYTTGCASPATLTAAMLGLGTLLAGTIVVASLTTIALLSLRRRLVRIEALSLHDRLLRVGQ